jgi:hypothetical protein
VPILPPVSLNNTALAPKLTPVLTSICPAASSSKKQTYQSGHDPAMLCHTGVLEGYIQGFTIFSDPFPYTLFYQLGPKAGQELEHSPSVFPDCFFL